MKKNNLYKIIEQMNNEDDSEILIHGELSQVPSEDLLSLLEKANDISLTTEEKTAGASAFRAFMEINTPANVPAESIESTESVKTSNVQKPKEKLKSLYTSWDILTMKASREASRALVFIKKNHMAYTAVVLLFAFLFTSSIAYASQDSLPGDILYPVKIHVHEKIESVLATKTEDKARVAVKHAVNRVKEAETLASEGKIDKENRASIDAAIEKDSSKAEASLARLSDEGKADLAVQISSDYEDSLSIFAKNIENISAKESARVAISVNEKATRITKLATTMERSNKSEDTNNTIETENEVEKASITKNIEIKLQNKLKVLAEQRIALEAKLSASSTIVATKKNANSEQDSSKQKIDNIEKYVKVPDENFTISATEIKEIKDKVEVAKNTYQQGTQKMNVGAYGNALTLFKNAKTDAENAEKKLINSYKKIVPADSANPGNSYGATYVGSSKKRDGTTTTLLNIKSLTIVDLDAFGSSTQSNTVASSSSSTNIEINSSAAGSASSGVPPTSGQNSSVTTPTASTPAVSTPAGTVPSASIPAVSAPAVSVPGL